MVGEGTQQQGTTSLTLEQVNQMIAVAVGQGIVQALHQAVAAMQHGGGAGRDEAGPRGGDASLTEKAFQRIENFQGESCMWKTWASSFKTIVKTKSGDLFKAMEITEKALDVVTVGNVNLMDEFLNVDNGKMDKLSAALYQLSTIMTTQEALSLVESTGDMDGFSAWQRLHNSYNPLSRLVGDALRQPRGTQGKVRMRRN